MRESNLLELVRMQQPVIHCITNYVTANDVANMILAAGASPILADSVKEVEDIAELSQGLVLNLGTLKEAALDSMLLAGKKAAQLGHPIVLDPVGAAASVFRRETALHILQQIPCSVIRGNASEIRALAQGSARSRGVDADGADSLTEDNCQAVVAMVQEFSRKTKAVIVMTGAQDLVADGTQACMVKNGHPMMGRITGSGCMLDGVLASFLAAGVLSSEEKTSQMFFHAVYAAVAQGICGELAFEKTVRHDGGTGSFRMYLIDAMSRLTDETIRRMKKIEI